MSIESIKTTSGKPKYRVRIWCRGERVDEAIFTNKEDAEKWERERKVKQENEQNFPDKQIKMTFEELFTEWMSIHAEKNKAPASVVKDKQMFKNYLRSPIGNRLITDLRPNEFDILINSLTKKTDLKNATINRVLETARAVFNFAVVRRYLNHNPMAAIKMLPVHDQPFDYWSMEEASRFLTITSQKYQGEDRWKYVFYLLLLSTGVRLGEAVALSWNNILFDQGLIRIMATYDGATRKIKQTTKGKKVRYVPLDDTLKLELLNLKSHAEATYVFVNGAGNVLDRDSFRRRCYLKDIVEAEVRRIRIHDLRHTFASHFIMNGGMLADLQAILGHCDVKMVLRYAHLAPSYIASKAGVVRYDIGGSENFKGSDENQGEVVKMPLGISRPVSSPRFRP